LLRAIGVKEAIANDASFVDDLGADFWIQLNSLWLSKKNLNVKFQTKMLKKFTTVRQAIDYVEKNNN